MQKRKLSSNSKQQQKENKKEVNSIRITIDELEKIRQSAYDLFEALSKDDKSLIKK